MSTNVSLANAGTSLNFDGQALQIQQEAEIEREEQMQQNELRQLLSNAFDDLDDDILSVASSEEDSANNSQVCSHHDSMLGSQPPGVEQSVVSGDSSVSGAVSVAAVIPIPPSQPPTSGPGTHLSQLKQPPHWGRQDGGSSHTHTQPPQHPARPDGAQWEESGQGTQWVGSKGAGNQMVAERDTSGDAWRERWSEQTEGCGQVSEGNSHEPPQRDSVNSTQDSHQSWAAQRSQQSMAYPYGSVPLTSQPASLPACSVGQPATFPSTSVAQYWSSDGRGNSHQHSQPHPYPMYTDSMAHNYTLQQAESQPLYHTDQFHFAADAFGVKENCSPLSGQVFTGLARSWNTAEKKEAGATVQHGYLTASHSDSGQPGYLTAAHSDSGQAGYLTAAHSDSGQAGYLTAAHSDSGQAGYLTAAHSDSGQAGYLTAAHSDNGQPGWSKATDDSEGAESTCAAYAVHLATPHSSLPSRARWDGGDHGGKGTGVRDAGETGGGQVLGLNTVTGKEGDNYDHYTVKYTKLQQPVQAVTSTASELKVNFITQEGDNEEAAQLSQLQMLYRSRGRQLEDVRGELEQLRQESAKERRRLKHLLSVATGEKEGMERSLGQCQQLLQEVRGEQEQTTEGLHTADAQIQALTLSKEELVKKLQSAETTIENLSHQVAGLQGTDSLTQARHQHEAVISSMQQRVDEQLLDLKQKLDIANEAITQKTEEVGKLQAQVRQQTRLAEEAQVSRGETINQLTRSLEESQHRCQVLLDASSSEEVSKLRAQLQQSLMSKKMSDEMCNSLQVEVQELKEQLNMLESATSLGALSINPHGSAFTDDSITDLGIRKTLNFSTPDSTTRFDSSQSSEDLVIKLRRELERCVISNREKRSKVGELQQHNKRMQQDLTELRQQLSDAQHTIHTMQVKLTGYEERLGGSLQPSAVEARLKRDIENMQLENQALLRDIEEYKSRVNEVSANEEQLMQLNSSLKEQISALVTQHDLDKQQAVERCRQTCEDIHKTARDQLERQLRSEMFADQQDVILKYEEQLNRARQKLEDVQEELDKVKDLYIQTCQDLSQQEEALRSQEQDLEQAIAAEKKKWESEHDTAMEAAWQQRLETERKKWESEMKADMEKDWQQRLETERKKWESEMKADMEKDWQQRLETERKKWESEMKADMEKDWQQRLETEQQSWESAKNSIMESEWQKRLERERKSWEIEKQAAVKAEWADRLENERRSWQVHADRKALEQADMAVEQARRRWQEETQEQLKLVTAQLEECQVQHKREMAAMESKWQQEVADKEAELEKQLEQHVQQAIDAELHTQLAQQRTMLLEQAQKTLQLELSQAEERHAKELQKERERVVAEVQQQPSDSSTQEVARWKEEALRLQAELAGQKEAWRGERARLLAAKDEERRQAVASVRSECQADYQRFMEENKATLDSALDSARKRHHQELGELEARYKEELAALRAVEQELRQVALAAEGSGLGAVGQSQTEEALLRQVERLRKEVEKRDQLLQQADAHMEQEVQRLKDTMAENDTKQREKDSLRLQAQYSQAMLIGQKERTRLEHQLEQLAEQLRKEKERRGDAGLAEEKAQLVSELRRVQEEKERVERQQAESRQRLQQQVEGLQQDKERLTHTLQECQTALRALTHDKQMRQQQHQQQVAALKQRCEHSKGRQQQAEAALKAVNQQHKQDVDRLQDSLRSAHQQDLAALTAQLAQAQKQQQVAMEELQAQHKAEKMALVEELERKHQADTHNMMEEFRRQAQRALSSTPTQTDADESLCGIKDQYFNAVQKIKEEVMNHISQANERAAVTMKAEIRLERQRTIHHLRGRCKSRLHHILHTHIERSQSEAVWTLVDQMLDSLFDSVSSSRSATPNTSTLVTPRSSEEDMGRNSQDSEREGLRGGAGGMVNTSNGSAPFSTPQSLGSDRYSLPSALARVELDHYQSDSSLTDLQGSGVFYSLEPDDAASVTDSELEFKVPLAVGKAGGRRVAFDSSARTATRKRRSTPPKVNTDLSVFVSKDVNQMQESSLLSPKLHREIREEEENAGLTAADVTGGKAKDASGWKEVDGEGWMAAVGGSNLWQAFTDLRSLEMEEKEPRRQLRFASQSFLDNYTDSDGSSASDGKGRPHRKSHGKGGRSQARLSFKQAGGVLSRSEDFTQPGKARQHSRSVKKVMPGETAPVTRQPQPTPSHRSPQPTHIHSPADPSLPPHQDTRPSSILPAKLLLNPKDFLSQSGRKTSPGGQQERGKEAETLDSMLERLGIGGGHSRSHRSLSVPGKKLQSKQDRQSDSVVSGTSMKHTVDVTASDRVTQPSSQKSKSRTRSADNTWFKQPRLGKDAHSVFAPLPSDQPPLLRASQPHRHGHRGDGEVLQRSLEDLQVNSTRSPLSRNSKVKSRSEQALHMLTEVGGEEEGRYSYTPLQHLLPPPTPSTSLLSTYSLSEGDLSHLPRHLAWDGELF